MHYLKRKEMPAYIVDLKADRRWIELIERFKADLLERFGDSLLKIVALYSPNDRIYESNVLVVVKKGDQETVERVIEAAIEAERSMGLEGVISPLVVDPEERRIIEGFEGFEVEQEISREEWVSLVRDLCIRLRGSTLLKIVALYSPNDRVYESNVLVVVKKGDQETVERVIEAAIEAERSMGLEGVISPLVVGPEERRIIEGFEGFEVVCQ